MTFPVLSHIWVSDFQSGFYGLVPSEFRTRTGSNCWNMKTRHVHGTMATRSPNEGRKTKPEASRLTILCVIFLLARCSFRSAILYRCRVLLQPPNLCKAQRGPKHCACYISSHTANSLPWFADGFPDCGDGGGTRWLSHAPQPRRPKARFRAL